MKLLHRGRTIATRQGAVALILAVLTALTLVVLPLRAYAEGEAPVVATEAPGETPAEEVPADQTASSDQAPVGDENPDVQAGSPDQAPVEGDVPGAQAATPEQATGGEEGPGVQEATPEQPTDGEGEPVVQTITTTAGLDLSFMGNDYVWAGETLNLSGVEVTNDLLAAGRSVTADGCKVGGSVRMAGQNVFVSNATVQENITLAGQNVGVNGSQGNAIALAGQNATFSGTCSELTMYAQDVYIDGTVEGDAVVGAQTVTIGPNARITGTLHVSADKEPTVQEGAQVSNLDYSVSEEDDVAAGQAGVVAAGLLPAFLLGISITSVIGTLVVAVCAERLFGRHTKAASDMIRSRVGVTIASGAVGMLVAPIAVILLCVLVVTLPIALCGVFALLAMAMVSSGFAAASLSKIAFPKMGRYAGALAGGAIVGAAKLVPVLGGIVRVAAFVYLLGYVLRSIYLGLDDDASSDEHEDAGVESALPRPPAGL